MGKVKRLSNRQLREAIKRNELEEWVEQTSEWVKKHLENFLIGVVLLVVVAVLVPYWLTSQGEQSAEAAMQLRTAQSDFQRALGGGDVDSLRQARAKLQAVATGYAGDPSAAVASLAAAQADLALGETDQAMANFQGFLGQYGQDHPMAGLAMAGMAQVMERKGQYEQAASQYLAIEQMQPPAPNLGLSLLDAARCLRKAGKVEQARSLVERAEKQRESLGLSRRLVALAKEGL